MLTTQWLPPDISRRALARGLRTSYNVDVCDLTPTMSNMDEILAAAERATGMTADERIRKGFRLFEHGRDYIVRSIERTFPEMPPAEVQRVRDRVIRQCKMWGVL